MNFEYKTGASGQAPIIIDKLFIHLNALSLKSNITKNVFGYICNKCNATVPFSERTVLQFEEFFCEPQSLPVSFFIQTTKLYPAIKL